jgi:hypothetical protein
MHGEFTDLGLLGSTLSEQPGMPRARLDDLSRRLLKSMLPSACLLFAGCSTQTLFQSNFATAIGQPPAHAQQVGTANSYGPTGSVVVESLPPPVAGYWVRIGRADTQSSEAALQGVTSGYKGPGTYTISMSVLMPTGTGLATISLEPAGQSINVFGGFLHLDLMEDDTVRIDDDDSTKFGKFPRDQLFILQVTLTVGATASANIALSGANTQSTSQSKDFAIQPFAVPLAQQFGAVRIWMGLPWQGAFYAQNVLVTKNQ